MKTFDLSQDTKYEKPIVTYERVRKKTVGVIKNRINLIMGLFIIISVIIILTTDLKLTSVLDLAEIGLTVFVIVFGSYLMYINSAGAGIKGGTETPAYKEAKKRHEELRAEIITKKLLGKLPEFCLEYVTEELKNTRESILNAAGMSYEAFEAEWLGKDKKTVLESKILTDAQKKAVVSANNVKPITLTSDMIFKSNRLRESRNPLGVNPQKAKTLNYIFKFLQVMAFSVVPAIIVMEVSGGFTWASLAQILIKILPMVSNAFLGYEYGWKNITIDTVNFLNDQSDLMCDFLTKYEKNTVG